MNDTPVDAPAPVKVTIDWYRSTPWWRLASQSIVISWRSTHVLLCALALLLSQIWVLTSSFVFGVADDTNWLAPSGQLNFLSRDMSSMYSGVDGPLTIWRRLLDPMYQFLRLPTFNGAAHCIATLIGVIAIWAFVGGCLSRRSVMEFGTMMTAPWAATIRFVTKRWQSIAWSVTMPSGLIAIIALLPLIVGWISNIPAIGPWCAGLLLLPLAFAAIGIGWCAAITVLGYPLSVCSIVTEKQADAYDGISRSAAYVFQRPLTLALCLIGAEVLGKIGGTIFSLVIFTGMSVVGSAFDIGSMVDLKNMDNIWISMFAAIPTLLVNAFGFSFFWSASAATYLILRKDVDDAEFDVIDMDSDSAPKALPELPKKTEPAPSTPTSEPEPKAEAPI